ncbi:hypothetical protein C8Q73DRAFT_795831 [Cubamyces lactineus]|nr:hypothetical protein C8Q73DRAFT_795831 [Cubamyces lactineus]
MKALAAGPISLILLVIGANAAATPVLVADATATSFVPEDNTSLTNGTELVGPCYWAGDGRNCKNNFCPPGYKDCGRDPCGDGVCCDTGVKVHCCLISSGYC